MSTWLTVLLNNKTNKNTILLDFLQHHSDDASVAPVVVSVNFVAFLLGKVVFVFLILLGLLICMPMLKQICYLRANGAQLLAIVGQEPLIYRCFGTHRLATQREYSLYQYATALPKTRVSWRRCLQCLPE